MRDFKLKKHRMHLAAGLCPDLLGELTAALPRPPTWISGERKGK